MKTNEIQNLIKYVSSKENIAEVKIQQENFMLVIKTNSSQGKNGGIQQVSPQNIQVQEQIQVTPQVSSSSPKPPVEENANLIEIKSQMIGTFYRRPKPDSENFVEVGADIVPGKVLCIIEAMKLFNEIESEISGKIVKILLEDNTPVEFDQPLFLVEKA